MNTQEPRKCCDECMVIVGGWQKSGDPVVACSNTDCPCHHPGKEKLEDGGLVTTRDPVDIFIEHHYPAIKEPQPVEEGPTDDEIRHAVSLLRKGELTQEFKKWLAQHDANLLSSDRERVRAELSKEFSLVVHNFCIANELSTRQGEELHRNLLALTTPQQ